MSTISQKLDFRQQQNLVMTPQMQQAIKILQMTNAELSALVEEELAQNPLLEKDDQDERERDGEASDHNLDHDAGHSDPDHNNTGHNNSNNDGDGDYDAAQGDGSAPEFNEEFDGAWTGNEAAGKSGGQDFDSGSMMASAGAGGSHSFDDADMSFENRMSREVTLREHLEEQLHLVFADPRDRMIGAGVIDLLDEGGYLRVGVDELAKRLGCKTDRIDNILPKLKQFDPTGIFAADLKECLALQLEEQGRLDDPMRVLLDNLAMVASYDLKKLSEKCGVNETYLADMLAEIRTLNPKPATLFDHLVVQTAVPDVLMKRLPKHLGGGWRVELNSDTLPKVLVNNDYYIEVSKTAKDKKDRTYLDEQLNAANWLVRAMDQRAKTILKVAGEIIEEQEAFFLYGVEFLRPLTLKDIAERIDMHESTVSRVTTNKYIGTPRGIFELKYFFSTALGDGDNAHSAEAVRAKIRNLIDAEAPDAILSDDAIADSLMKEGIDIARRTVAKYREAMNIGSSVQRRKQKNSPL